VKPIKVTDFRAHLPKYLAKAAAGETVMVLSRVRPIARLVPAVGVAENAREKFAALRKQTRIGDVISPVDVAGVPRVVVLDTNALIFDALNPARLSRKARAA
jgi:prevent-host-death family protein